VPGSNNFPGDTKIEAQPALSTSRHSTPMSGVGNEESVSLFPLQQITMFTEHYKSRAPDEVTENEFGAFLVSKNSDISDKTTT